MKRKSIKFAIVIIILLCCLPLAAQRNQPNVKTQRRIALVIGNSNYLNIDSLESKNPSNDAVDVANALRDLDFEVFLGVDLTFRETLTLINSFGARLAETRGIGLFYYSGHAFHINNENFLLPVDTRIIQEADSSREGISLNLILAKMNAAKNSANLVLLDCVGKNQFIQSWRTEQKNIVTIGFTKIIPPKGTVVFYSNQPENNSAERFGRNGYFAVSILKQLNKTGLDFGQFTNAVSADLAERTYNQQKPFLIGTLPKNFYFVDELHQPKTKERKSLTDYFEAFKSARKYPCGQRDELRSVGKEIIENYVDDVINRDVIEFVKKHLEIFEKEEPLCDRSTRYDNSYTAKNWRKFFEFSKEVINFEGETSIALDVMLTLIKVGYQRVIEDDNDDFNGDTVLYAKKAIKMIDSGIKSKSDDWGVYDGFESEGRSMAWLNYTIGYIAYSRLNQQDEGVSYLYKATKSREFEAEWTIYQTIGNYYFDRSMSIYATYKEKHQANLSKITDETNAILSNALGYAERAIDAYGRARNIYSIKLTGVFKEKIVYVEKLDEIYTFRFNFVPKMPTWGMNEYVTRLISRSMPDPATKVEPIPIL
jgi:Caspase domain